MFMINVYAFTQLLHAGLRNLSLQDFPSGKVDVSLLSIDGEQGWD
jgi:hypothetical protein